MLDSAGGSAMSAVRSRKRLGASPDVALWLFDFDNTLALLETEVDWAASRRELEAFLRKHDTPEDLFDQFPSGNLLLYDALRSRLLGNGAAVAAAAILNQASAIIEKHELAGVDRAAPTQGALDLLRSLDARGVPIAIVTSNCSRTVARWIRRNRVGGAIRAIVGRETLRALKPAPDMVERALELCGVEAGSAALVGDSSADFNAALAAGVRFYGVAIRPASRDALVSAGASEIFASPAALGIHFNLFGLEGRAPKPDRGAA
jgi:phosphoglycolate phosphatase-like HAD superfamily hydrolase